MSSTKAEAGSIFASENSYTNTKPNQHLRQQCDVPLEMGALAE